MQSAVTTLSSTMRLSWLLGKIKRFIPFVAVVIILMILYQVQYGNPSQVQKQIIRKSEISTDNGLVPASGPTKPPPPSQWLVLEPEEQSDPCNMLAGAFHQWTILLLNAEKKGASHSACHYLSMIRLIEIAHEHNLSSADSFTVGFLYAVKNFAEAIYTVPSHVPLTDLHSSHLPGRNLHKSLVTSSHAPLLSNQHHFGCNLSSVDEKVAHGQPPSYRLCDIDSPAIDVPAAIRLKRWKMSSYDTTITPRLCDPSSPSVILDKNSYADFHMDGARVAKHAFWMLSQCASGKVFAQDCHTWNLMAQMLLKGTGFSVNIFLEKVDREVDVDKNIVSMFVIDFLKDWSCPLKSVMACGINLLEQVNAKGLISSDFARKQIKWFKLLNSVSYKFPSMDHKSSNKICKNGNGLLYNPVNFTDVLPWKPGMKFPFTPMPNNERNKDFHSKTCANHEPGINFDLTQPWMQMPDILLIVVFNNPHYETLPYIDIMYRSIFPHILYCGPQPLDEAQFQWSKQYSLSFLTFSNIPNHSAGVLNYDCLLQAMAMNYDIEGYLTIADDMILMPHNLPDLRKQSIWFLPKSEVRIGEIRTLRECKLGMCDFHPHWHWWEDYQKSTISALNDLKDRGQYSSAIFQCYQQLVHKNGAEMRPNGAYSDIFYIPQRLKEPVMEILQVFLEHQVMVEIAVPTVINCLEDDANIESLPGYQNWEKERDMPWMHFTAHNVVGKFYFHPTKWSYLKDGSKELIDFYCDTVVPFIHDPYARLQRS